MSVGKRHEFPFVYNPYGQGYVDIHVEEELARGRSQNIYTEKGQKF